MLSSGSLKEMAEEYGVSYPTIRQRLDGLIEKLRRATKEKPVSELRRVVRQMVENGELDLPEARKILGAGARDVKDLHAETGKKGRRTMMDLIAALPPKAVSMAVFFVSVAFAVGALELFRVWLERGTQDA